MIVYSTFLQLKTELQGGSLQYFWHTYKQYFWHINITVLYINHYINLNIKYCIWYDIYI